MHTTIWMYLIKITIQIPYKDSESADSSTLQGGESHCGSRWYLCLPTQNDGKTAQKYIEISLVLKPTWFRPLQNTYHSFDVTKTSFLCKFPSLKTSAKASPICSSFPYKCAPSMCLYPYCSASLTALRSSPSVASQVLQMPKVNHTDTYLIKHDTCHS